MSIPAMQDSTYRAKKNYFFPTQGGTRGAASMLFPTSRGGRHPQAESRAGPLREEIEGAAGLLGEGAADVQSAARPRLAPGAGGHEEAPPPLGRHPQAA